MLESGLAWAVVALAAASIVLSPRARGAGAFFRGLSADGAPPGLLTLTLSQVTTWIFARSLLNAAILGYFFGIAGTVAYAAYYLSFLTGASIVDSIRFRHGFDSVQQFLAARFGAVGTACYNAVVGVRLVSEVFANLLVIGILFGAVGTDVYVVSIIGVAVVALAYSMLGGLHASLRTDVLQMAVFLVALTVVVAVAFGADGFSWAEIGTSSPDVAGPGWVLLAVALMQVWSYPLHDPVMMDRGFLADRRTTRLSFYHAAWLSALCIVAFGLLGVYAGLNAAEGEAMTAALTRLLGDPAMLVFNLALIVSAMSTLDSTFASAAKLAVVDMGIGRPTVRNGRLAMATFMVAGVALVFVGSKDLFSAVAVSGTASMYLAPVVFFSIWGRQDVPVWSYLIAFAVALGGAGLYFAEDAGYVAIMEPLVGLSHKYSKLLAICGAVMALGCAAFAIGIAAGPRRRALVANGTAAAR